MAEAISPERWQQVKSIFETAITLDQDERAAFLSDSCREDTQLLSLVNRLISADERAEAFLESSPVNSLLAGETTTWIGKRVGHYRIVEELGRGGMGAVYLAHREDEFEKVVALKIIKRGMDSDDMLRRFRNERQILAQLDHPNIARLLDGGTTDDGLPYFVMEYVNGAAIDDYAEQHHLTITDRLKLFRQVCAAVSYAHQHLAVHRDIKPSNIIVTADGLPKLLDFGIAKVLAPGAAPSETMTGMQMMTPEYASPEQARGENSITTATDIYSLGVVLYELLTGESPYEFPNRRVDEVARVICETEPQRPSRIATTPEHADRRAINRQLRGDIDNILLMSLRKDPARRYSSVEQFSEDIRRHLEGLPVIARPDTLWYRSSKFINRNRAASIGGALVALTLVVGLGATIYQARVANRERERAERRFKEVRELANSVVFKYHDAIAELPGSTKVREMLVKDALQYLDRLSQEAAGDRSLQRELALAYLKVGNVQGRIYDANLGDVTGALASYRKAITLLEALAQNSSDLEAQSDLRDAYQTLALTIANGGDPEAMTYIDKAIQLSERLATANPTNATHQLMLARSYVLRVDTRRLSLEESFANFQKAQTIVEHLIQNEPLNTEALKSLGVIYSRLGEHSLRAAKAARSAGKSDATQLFQQAIDYDRLSSQTVSRLVQIDSKNNAYRRLIAIAENNLGEALLEAGDTQNAVNEIRNGLSYFSENARTDPANLNAKYELALSTQQYIRALLSDHQVAEARKQFTRVVALTEELIAKDSKNREYMNSAVTLREEVGDGFLALGSFNEAYEQYRAARAYADKLIGEAPTLRTQYALRFDEKFGDYYATVAERSNESEQKRREYWVEAKTRYQSALTNAVTGPRANALAQKIAKCEKALASR
jgi:non-specific serine/threonine protein kinase/serine/threonine-protein kinase